MDTLDSCTTTSGGSSESDGGGSTDPSHDEARVDRKAARRGSDEVRTAKQPLASLSSMTLPRQQVGATGFSNITAGSNPDGPSSSSKAFVVAARVQEELQQLRSDNRQLKLKIRRIKSYYEEDMKRCEREKLSITSAVSGWINSMTDQTTGTFRIKRSIIADSVYMKTIVRYPARPLSDMLQRRDDIFFLSTCQAPYFVEVSRPFSIFY
jgi:hypothetical protein